MYFSRPWSPCRAPTPDCLTPPDGVPFEAYAAARLSLTLTFPDSIRRATSAAALRSVPQTDALRP